MLLAVLFVIGAAVTPLVYTIDLTAQVTIESGKLQGFIVEVNNLGGSKIRKYLGIPFAEAERFQTPKPPSKWSDVQKMTSIGKACPQLFSALGTKKKEDMDENCLNLNVFVPDNSNSSSRLPVMVWIHGGGFIGGSNEIFDGSYLAVLGQVVVVAINYRLSVFGFLTNGKDGDIKGNYGMLDQVEALKWVRKNIEAFNGDPNKVTIFGESAGGASVSLLMLSKQSKGLFHRAIQQSGDAAAPWSTGWYDGLVKSIKLFAKNVGCPEDLSKLKGCLANKEFMEIINATLTVPFPSFIPVVDGNFLEDAPSVLYEKQQIHKTDVMMGVNNDEGIVFTNAIEGIGIGLNVTHGVSRETFIKSLKGGYISLVLPDPKSVLIDATIYRYTDWTNISSPTRNRRMYIDLQGDSTFVAPTIKAAEAYSKKKAAIYFYHLEYRDDGPFLGLHVPSWIKAYHGADLTFVFGFVLYNETNTTSAKFAHEVIKLWSNYAKTGNPNSPHSVGVTWPQYTPDQPKYLSLKPNMEVNSHLRAEYMAYWNKFIPDALRATTTTNPLTTKPPCKCEPCAGSHLKATAVMVFLLYVGITLLF